jgi:glycosyltransferase involved in cell wall biosynthesis
MFESNSVKLSIITVNLNNLEGLRETIKSVICQDFKYIIIDRASSYGSYKLIEDHNDQLAFWVSEQDRDIYKNN